MLPERAGPRAKQLIAEWYGNNYFKSFCLLVTAIFGGIGEYLIEDAYPHHSPVFHGVTIGLSILIGGLVPLLIVSYLSIGRAQYEKRAELHGRIQDQVEHRRVQAAAQLEMQHAGVEMQRAAVEAQQNRERQERNADLYSAVAQVAADFGLIRESLLSFPQAMVSRDGHDSESGSALGRWKRDSFSFRHSPSFSYGQALEVLASTPGLEDCVQACRKVFSLLRDPTPDFIPEVTVALDEADQLLRYAETFDGPQ